MEKIDVVIVGAGLSGIGAAYHLKDKCPHLSFTILEARSNLGGTWDLFKYPGVRSDSDMYTFGFKFHPWKSDKLLADGSSILSYIHETVDKYDLRKYIQFNKKVISSTWSSQEKRWNLALADTSKIACKFLFMCSGYYNYEQGYQPKFPNIDNFKGQIVHPQKWDDKLNYEDKEMVIIGSGATAITLLPTLAQKAKSVTMLQRSPTYILGRKNKDGFVKFLKRILPDNIAHQIIRWRNILLTLLFYQFSKKYPDFIKKYLLKNIQKILGEKYNSKDFTPHYNPWDQRLCVVPNNDLFEAINQGKALIKTDTIKSFTENEILLDSGKKIQADIIVTATGLDVQLLGGMKVFVNDQLIDIGKTYAYKGTLLSGIPNLAINIGYTNSSWTLKSDLNCEFVTKLLNHMKKNGYQMCTPVFNQSSSQRLLDLDAGYLLRAKNILPRQGIKSPWRVNQNHIKEVFLLRYGTITTKDLKYE